MGSDSGDRLPEDRLTDRASADPVSADFGESDAVSADLGEAAARAAGFGAADLEEPVGEWARDLVPTFACWDVLECLHSRRAEHMPAELIAHVVGRAERDLAPTFDRLISAGLVRRTFGPRGGVFYTYAPRTEMAARVDHMFGRLPSQELRVELVKEILKLGGGASSRGEKGGCLRGLLHLGRNEQDGR